MTTPRVPAGSRIYIQSAISAVQAITTLTKAAPPVLTYAGTDSWTNGSYVALSSMYGMTEFEDALSRVANVNTTSNTLEMEDQNSTGYGTFVSGNAQLVTLGTELVAASDFSFSGGDQQFAEYSFLWDKMKRKMPSTKDGMTATVKCIWDPTDVSQQAVLAASDASSKLAIKIAHPDGLEMLFFGFVASSGLPKTSGQNDVMMTDVTIVSSSRMRYALP
jgi:hypothetical protein